MQIEHEPVGEGILLAAKIVLNLEHNEYDDFELTDGEGNSILWQQDAAEQLKQHLHKNGEEARRYKNGFDDKNIHFSHNAICIHGGRGTGKTVFLKNIKSVWQQHKKDNQDLPKLHFLSSIDPTMLHEHDSFASVIIAQLYNAVESELSSRIDEGQKDRFYQALRDLANAHGKSSEYEDATGIDRILNYRSGVKVQEYFHRFVLECTHILNCDGVVLRIDDVDMSLDRAFEVLDDVRKFLSCPFIIPVVSGDLALYSRIMENHFTERLQGSNRVNISQPVNHVSVNNEGAEHIETNIDGYDITADSSRLKNEAAQNTMANQLNDAYLTKVFPNHLRINLLPIELLQADLGIKEARFYKSADEYIYPDYLSDLERLFFPLCNGRNNSHHWRKPYNARELNQLVSALPPSEIFSHDHRLRNYPSDEQLHWWQNWAEAKQDGMSYLNVLSYFQSRNALTTEGLGALSLFNLIKQVNLSKELGWGYKAVAKEQRTELRLMPTRIRTKTSRMPSSSKTYTLNRNLLNHSFNEDDLTLRSMPPLEFISNNLRIITKNANSKSYKRFLYLYTHSSYYAKDNNQTLLAFFSRAFDILACSLIELTGNASLDWQGLLPKLMRKVPFYSIGALNPLKILELDELKDDELEASNNSDVKQCTNDFLAYIGLWEDYYCSDEDIVLKESLKHINIFPLLASVFNMVFTQLHLYRMEISRTRGMPSEHLSDAIVRFKLIVINAFIFFIKSEGETSEGNIAITTSTETVRDISQFYATSNPLRINFSDFLDIHGKAILTSELSELSKTKRKLVQAIWHHPVFFTPEHSTEETKELLPRFIKLGRGDSAETENKGEFELPSNFASAKALLNYLSDPKTISRKGKRIANQDVTNWAERYHDVAREFNDRLMMLLNKDLDELIRLEGNPTTNTGIVYKVLLKHFENN